MEKKKKNRVRIALAYKIYFIVLISVAFCAIFIGSLNYYEDKDSLSKNLGSSLEKVARTAVLGVDAHMVKSIEGTDDYYYEKVRSYLLKVKRQNDIEVPVFIFREKNKVKVSLVATTEPSSMVGAEYRLNPTMKKVFSTGKSTFSPMYTDKSGSWISAYAPIKDAEGDMAGVLELNIHIGDYIQQLRFQLLKVMALCLIGLFIGTFLGIPLLNPILRSIDILNTAASEMEKGNYDYEIKLKSSDEIGRLADAFERMRRAIRFSTEQLNEALLNEKKIHLDSVKALTEMIVIREPHMKGHIERVSRSAVLIAKELDLSAREIETLKYGCMLHDIGKIGIDINLLNKPSKLTAPEYEFIKKHPPFGAQIIEGIEFLQKARDVVLCHQERYDGKGYPEGLKGEEIPIGARIVSLVDAYDAMVSERPYKEKSNKGEVIAKLKEESGKQFDPKVVEAFLRIADRL